MYLCVCLILIAAESVAGRLLSALTDAHSQMITYTADGVSLLKMIQSVPNNLLVIKAAM
jgi:hypothetical protein